MVAAAGGVPVTPAAPAVLGGEGDDSFPELFEGPEKTLSLCFKARKIAAQSLRFIPQKEWDEILKHAKCEILSVVESNPPVAPAIKEKKTLSSKSHHHHASTKGLTGYLLSESSLFLSDTTLTLKTCGRTTPLAALEPILDLVVPSWRAKEPDQYLKYASFMRLGYMRPDEQLEPHTSWEQEVGYMERHFRGEAVVLGSEYTSAQHIYVANYVPKDEVIDTFSTQVALTNLETSESMHRYGGGEENLAEGVDTEPLATVWSSMHGDAAKRSSFAKDVKFDEKFFEPIGYSSNAVTGRHFTTVHITPQPGCSYLSVETSMPMSSDARRRFVQSAEGMCRADTLALSEFSLAPSLFIGGQPPEVPGFEVKRSTTTTSSNFAAAHHHYERKPVCSKDAAEIVPPGSFGRSSTASTLSPAASPVSSPVVEASPAPFMPPAREFAGLQPAQIAEYKPTSAVVEAPVPSASAAVVTSESVVLEAPSEQKAMLAAAERFLASATGALRDAPVALVDLGAVRRRAELWHRLLPRVEPFYAVKCNPNPAIVETLWRIFEERGVGGFDAASPEEILLVLGLGDGVVERIVYANPCKQASAIEFANEHGVRRLVFDNASELEKLAALHPRAELLLRVQTDDALAQCPLSNKFGAAPADCGALLDRAQALGLQVVGVSFHVGSGCSERGAFRGALQRARGVFDEAQKRGFAMTLLDIGGGFPGCDEAGQATFADHAVDINEVLEELFPSRSVRVIAEPGRFFVASAQATLTTVVSVASSSTGDRYYLNDGVYGAFNSLIYDHARVTRPSVIRAGVAMDEAPQEEQARCTLFGPTCDGFDVISESMELSSLRVDDRLVFPEMGAYTTAATTRFNGFGKAETFLYESRLQDSRF